MPQEEKIFSILEVQSLISKAIEKTFTSDLNSLLITTEGFLGKFSAANQYFYFATPLRDDFGNVLLLDIPKKLVDETYQYRKVTVTGNLKIRIWNNRIEPRLDVVSIKVKDTLNENLIKKEILLIDVLKSCKDLNKPFPVKSFYTIALIHPAYGYTKDDFLRQLTDIESKVKVTCYPVNIQNKDEIKSAIKSANENILVLIRGGGEDAEFEIFNDKDLISTWASSSAYKITALGHTDHKFFIDLFSDKSCDTPTAAGVFVKEKIKEKTEKTQTEEILKKYTEDLTKEKEKASKYKSEATIYKVVLTILVVLLILSLLSR